jgi:hypothetical protein
MFTNTSARLDSNNLSRDFDSSVIWKVITCLLGISVRAIVIWRFSVSRLHNGHMFFYVD